MQGADHGESVQLLLLERCLGLVDRDRTRATGVVAPPAPPYLLLSHGEEFEEKMRLASEAAARFELYVELLCLEAVDRVVVEYFDVSVGYVQQQQKPLEQKQLEQQQQLEQQRQQRQEHLLFWSRCFGRRACAIVGHATATATAMEQLRKRKRDRERRPEVKQRRKEQRRRAEVHAVRSCCHVACVRRRAALVGVAGGVLACIKT